MSMKGLMILFVVVFGMLTTGCARNSVLVKCKTRDTCVGYNQELVDRLEMSFIGTPGLRDMKYDCSDYSMEFKLVFEDSVSMAEEEYIGSMFDQVIKEKLVSKVFLY